MTNDLITVCTATLGNSSWERLRVLLPELRRFTCISYCHIVSDDGTINDEAVQLQRQVSLDNNAFHYVNPGPYGVSFNLNFLLEKVKTPWAYLVECGLRPSMGWLEAAYAFIDQIHGKKFAGHEIGMVGVTHLQDWCCRLGGATPADASVMDWWQSNRPQSHIAHDQFWGNWNDGYWSWPRMQAYTEAACRSPESDSWYGEPAQTRDLVRQGQFSFKDYWPKHRRPGIAWYPGAFALINMKAWREVGGFENEVTFFEGMFSVKAGLAGYVSLSLQAPPWLHRPSLCFSVADEGKFPRRHAGVNECFLAKFGVNFGQAPELINKVIDPTTQARINDELPEVPLLPGWTTIAQYAKN